MQTAGGELKLGANRLQTEDRELNLTQAACAVVVRNFLTAVAVWGGGMYLLGNQTSSKAVQGCGWQDAGG